MLNLETIDAKIKELEKDIDTNDTLAHMALDNRRFDSAQEFADRADTLREIRDALRWACGEIAEF